MVERMIADRVVIYSKPVCKFCQMAKEFFKDHNIPYTEIYLDPKTDEYAEKVDELLNTTNHTTFPFIFIGTEFVGGYSDMVAAYNTLKLHEMLKTIGIELAVDF